MNKLHTQLFIFLAHIVISTPLFSFVGFFNALSHDITDQSKKALQELKEHKSMGPTICCACQPNYTITLESKSFQLCAPCTLNIMSIQSMIDMFPENIQTAVDNSAKIEV